MLQLDEYSNRLAHYLLSAGVRHGDSVALFMENKPEYIGLWLGCTKVGVVPALNLHNYFEDSPVTSQLSVTL